MTKAYAKADNKLQTINSRAKAKTQKVKSNLNTRMTTLKHKTKRAGAAGKSGKVERLHQKMYNTERKGASKLRNVKTKAAIKSRSVKKKYLSNRK